MYFYFSAMPYSICCTFPIPYFDSVCNAILYITFCIFHILNCLNPYAILYISYSSPYPICHAVLSLFHTTSFHMPCCKFTILLSISFVVHFIFRATLFCTLSCKCSFVSLCVACYTFTVLHCLIVYAKLYTDLTHYHSSILF